MDGLDVMAQSQVLATLRAKMMEAEEELQRAAKRFAETKEELISGGMVNDTMAALECDDAEALERIREMLRDELTDAALWYADARAAWIAGQEDK